MSDPLAAGARLFNEGRYFEAHEAFEDSWREASGDRKLALQALTQLAAGFHKIGQYGPSARGAKYLLEKSREKLMAHGEELGSSGPGVVQILDDALSALAKGRTPAAPTLRL